MNTKHLFKCPICKTTPTLITTPLWNGSHGYHGCYSYVYSCPKCALIKANSSSTVYYTPEMADTSALLDWNERVNEVRILMGLKILDEKIDFKKTK